MDIDEVSQLEHSLRDSHRNRVGDCRSQQSHQHQCETSVVVLESLF